MFFLIAALSALAVGALRVAQAVLPAMRERDADDRRVINVHLAEAGRTKLEAEFPQHLTALVEEFSVLSESELETLSDLCRRLGKGRDCAR